MVTMLLITALCGIVVAMSIITKTRGSIDCSNAESCDVKYEKGVESYLDNRYEDCVVNFECAIRKYRWYTKKLQGCRIKCKQDAASTEPFYKFDVDYLHFYEMALRNTLCILRCKNENNDTFKAYNINTEVERFLEEGKPYEYLHICYYQTKEFQKAASAAHTYLTIHPTDDIMLANLRFYKNLAEVDMDGLINYEAKEFLHYYMLGCIAYKKELWQDVQDNMEKSLMSFLLTEDECRAQCEGPFDQGWYPDFMPSISNHFTFCLRCKNNCNGKLSFIDGKKYIDLLPSHYHYLQYAYYKTSNLKSACEAAASYLSFSPNDNTMLDNMKFFKSQSGIEDSFFSPRPEAVHYVQRKKYEEKLLKFIFTEFNFDTSHAQKKLNEAK